MMAAHPAGTRWAAARRRYYRHRTLLLVLFSLALLSYVGDLGVKTVVRLRVDPDDPKRTVSDAEETFVQKCAKPDEPQVAAAFVLQSIFLVSAIAFLLARASSPTDKRAQSLQRSVGALSQLAPAQAKEVEDQLAAFEQLERDTHPPATRIVFGYLFAVIVLFSSALVHFRRVAKEPSYLALAVIACACVTAAYALLAKRHTDERYLAKDIKAIGALPKGIKDALPSAK